MTEGKFVNWQLYSRGPLVVIFIIIIIIIVVVFSQFLWNQGSKCIEIVPPTATELV